MRDHPRIRGEHTGLGEVIDYTTGSSPHTRGALWGTSPRPPRRTDHPRIRGEHLIGGDFQEGIVGSSPHTRGAQFVLADHSTDERIIPAYAGSTMTAEPEATVRSDHPRIRGEHGVGGREGVFAEGSSPHTRGAHPGS